MGGWALDVLLLLPVSLYREAAGTALETMSVSGQIRDRDLGQLL